MTSKPSLTNCPRLSFSYAYAFGCKIKRSYCYRKFLTVLFLSICQPHLGGYCSGVPPLPIPNREVKPACADGTAILCGRVGDCPLYIKKVFLSITTGRLLFLLYGRKAYGYWHSPTLSCNLRKNSCRSVFRLLYDLRVLFPSNHQMVERKHLLLLRYHE